MANNTNTGSERQYYIDWLRIMLIISVFLFHTGMIFNTWDWHVKNDILYGGVLRKVMIFLHNWRMPLLFMLSGAGTFFALGNKTTGQYLLERTRRLLILFCWYFPARSGTGLCRKDKRLHFHHRLLSPHV